MAGEGGRADLSLGRQGGSAGASPSVSTTTAGITSFRTSQLVCRAGLEFISSSHTWAGHWLASFPTHHLASRRLRSLLGQVTLGRWLLFYGLTSHICTRGRDAEGLRVWP